MQLRASTNRQGHLELEFVEHPEYDAMPRIAHLLEQHFGASMLQRFDGLDQRYWDLRISGQALVLHHDTFAGTSLFPKHAAGEAVLVKLQPLLECAALPSARV